MIKKAYNVQMTYEISEKEKEMADKSLITLDALINSLNIAEKHLNLMYIPFKENPETDENEIFKARYAMRLYRDKVAENFNNFKKIAFRSFVILKNFQSDTQISKLLKSFVMAIDDLEKQVNRFLSLFDDLKSKDFSTAVVKAISFIKKEMVELKQIIEDRIKDYIKTNVLARNWIDSVSKELETKVENKMPLVQKLIEERNKNS